MDRKLKKYAKKQMAQYRNEEFLEELKARQREKMNQHFSFNKRVVSLCVSLSVAIITLTVALLCVFLIKPTATSTGTGTPLQTETEVTPEKKYSENQESVASNLEEVNEVLSYISFSVGDQIVKYQDEEYEEILYFLVHYTDEDELSYFTFRVFSNPDYKVDETSECEKKGVVASHEIQYHETVNCEDDIYFFTESGKITTDREIILIDAEIIGFEENSHFIDFLNEIIQAKQK